MKFFMQWQLQKYWHNSVVCEKKVTMKKKLIAVLQKLLSNCTMYTLPLSY